MEATLSVETSVVTKFTCHNPEEVTLLSTRRETLIRYKTLSFYNCLYNEYTIIIWKRYFEH
jgi:hypothetical protein